MCSAIFCLMYTSSIESGGLPRGLKTSHAIGQPQYQCGGEILVVKHVYMNLQARRIILSTSFSDAPCRWLVANEPWLNGIGIFPSLVLTDLALVLYAIDEFQTIWHHVRKECSTAVFYDECLRFA